MRDVVVVGGGVVGAASARALARRGLDVVVLERFHVGHDRGSSHGDARVFRYSYDAPEWVRMMAESLALWRRLEEEAGEPLLTRTGGIDIDPPPQNAAALDAAGVPYEVLPAGEAMARHPSVALTPDSQVLVQDDAGIVHAERAWRALAAGAAAAGAELREGTPAVELRSRDEGVEVATHDGAVRARVAVVAAGAWTPSLLAPLGIDLPVRITRETPVYFRTRGAAPVVVDWRERPVRYALPSPEHGLKAAEHHGGQEVDPEEPRRPDEGSAARVRRWASELFPALAPDPAGAEACLYTTTADERFVLERHGPIVVASACSGHGFKFVPVTGERVAALAVAA